MQESKQGSPQVFFAHLLAEHFLPYEIEIALQRMDIVGADFFLALPAERSQLHHAWCVTKKLYAHGVLPAHVDKVLSSLAAARPNLADKISKVAASFSRLPLASDLRENSPSFIARCEARVNLPEAVTRLDELLLQRHAVNTKEERQVLSQDIDSLSRSIRAAHGFPEIGDRFAGTELLEFLGSGSFGSVWRSRALATGELRATKVFHIDKLESDIMLCRFIRSAEKVRFLKDAPHGGVVKIFDVAPSRLSFSMECARGVLSEDTICQWDFPVKIEWFMDLCETVAFAHKHSIIHRDIKPTNILLDHRNRPRLTDFDLALFGLSDLTVDGSSMVLGSLAFAAPEQLRNARSAAEPADVYSLGRLLHYLLIRRTPEVTLWGNHRVVELPGIPAIYSEIIYTATHPRIRDRYKSVEELLRAIQGAHSGWAMVRVAARRGKRWLHQNRGISSTVMSVLVASLFSTQQLALENARMERLNSDFDHVSGQVASISNELRRLEKDLQQLQEELSQTTDPDEMVLIQNKIDQRKKEIEEKEKEFNGLKELRNELSVNNTPAGSKVIASVVLASAFVRDKAELGEIELSYEELRQQGQAASTPVECVANVPPPLATSEPGDKPESSRPEEAVRRGTGPKRKGSVANPKGARGISPDVTAIEVPPVKRPPSAMLKSLQRKLEQDCSRKIPDNQRWAVTLKVGAAVEIIAVHTLKTRIEEGLSECLRNVVVHFPVPDDIEAGTISGYEFDLKSPA